MSWAPSHPFVPAGSTEAAHQTVDHLGGTEDQLQTAGGQQGGEEPNVELYHVLGLGAGSPPGVIGEILLITEGKNMGLVFC